MVMRCDPVEGDHGRSRVEVELRFKGGRTDRFVQELANLYQPSADSPEGQQLLEVRKAQQLKHADHLPKLQLQLFQGCKVPLTSDPSHRDTFVIDEPTLQQQAVRDELHKQRHALQVGQDKPAKAKPVTGPPWVVPAECPNCGARVDQAVSSKEQDPHCTYCHEPLPVTPAAAS
jgi:hypothetical protein